MPLGTVVRDEESGQLVVDLSREGQVRPPPSPCGAPPSPLPPGAGLAEGGGGEGGLGCEAAGRRKAVMVAGARHGLGLGSQS